MAEKPHYVGHRERLRERFLSRGPDAIADYELLEMLLFAASPRADVKPLAKRLLKHFGSFANVIHAEPERLREVEGIGPAAVAAVKVAEAAAIRMLRDEVMDRPVLSSWQALMDYCLAAMGHLKTEQFRILFLDRKNKLIADEVQQRGTVDHTPVYPREVVKRALDIGASAIILVHNHPSGDTTPSNADIEMTKKLIQAGRLLGITIHDHVIIGRQNYTSFKAMMLI